MSKDAVSRTMSRFTHRIVALCLDRTLRGANSIVRVTHTEAHVTTTKLASIYLER